MDTVQCPIVPGEAFVYAEKARVWRKLHDRLVTSLPPFPPAIEGIDGISEAAH